MTGDLGADTDKNDLAGVIEGLCQGEGSQWTEARSESEQWLVTLTLRPRETTFAIHFRWEKNT